jgi:hypothetical protein
MQKPSKEIQDRLDQINAGVQSFDAERKEKRKLAGPSRQLTDEELATLRAAYARGAEKAKDHPFGSSDEASKYWLCRKKARA